MSMRNLGTTPLRSSVSIRVVIGIVFVLLAGPVFIHPADAQATAAQDNQQLPPAALGPSTNAPPPHPVAPAEPAPQPGKTPATGQRPSTQGQGQGPSASDNGIYVFHAEAREVVLHATVIDDKNRLVTSLTKPDFSIFENDSRRRSAFQREDYPVAMGIIIDNSGSMREKRDEVNKAALNLVRSSNSDDQIFMVNFNDEPILDQEFTSDIKKLQAALEQVESRGGTALYDAIVAACRRSGEVAAAEESSISGD